LASQLRALGVRSGHALLVHASLSAIGYVTGGAAAVVAALRDAVGDGGVLVMPTGTPENSDTSRAYRRRVAGMSEEQRRQDRDRMPAFDKATSPAPGSGRIAEALRTSPGAVRSDHPQSSFAALGPAAAALMEGHELTCHLGWESPLGKLYDRSALVLMLGMGYRACSAFHLAEYSYTPHPPTRKYSCVISAGGERRWITYEDVILDDRDFPQIGGLADVEVRGSRGPVGSAPCRLMPMRDLVDFATKWMSRNRR
jgi:aminoglycoside 3-N-acetyltransferase